ncbi:uncharacterized protein BDZ99DRAFT_463098 [Mytilinidion resinicola]|uniref:Uncharacterized protein n=1 Tax=Mytilinidion resinicola TaxID=574789 RepID=A0A6A6YPT5_9PEZI|nr:uncharacterized protein BDZ99DRAFT_463098 [Mytilinidion resinicola]KAF2810538.1 hypothetical protein BDZ99DRAFT_463098 [Mytilinidion resinicola]
MNTYQPPLPLLPPFPHNYQPQESLTVPPPASYTSGVHTSPGPNSPACSGSQPDPQIPPFLLPPFPGDFQMPHVLDSRQTPQNQVPNNSHRAPAYQPPTAPFQDTQPLLNPYEQQLPLRVDNPYPVKQEPWPPFLQRHIPQSSSVSSMRSTTPSTPPSRSSSRRSSFTPSSFDDDSYSRPPRRLGDFRSRYRNSLEQRRVGSPASSQYRPELRSTYSARPQNEEPEWAGQRPRTPPHLHFQQHPNFRPPPPPTSRRARPDLNLPDPSTNSVLGRIRDTSAQRNERLKMEGREWKRQRRNWGPSR